MSYAVRDPGLRDSEGRTRLNLSASPQGAGPDWGKHKKARQVVTHLALLY